MATKKNGKKSSPVTTHEVWVYMSTDSEAGSARNCSAVSVFGSRAEAVKCMENTIAEDIAEGVVDADYVEYDGYRDLPNTLPDTPTYWTAETPDGRYFHSVTKTHVAGPLLTTVYR